MKKIFLIITAVVCSMTVAADGFEYNYLAFTRSNGVDQTVSVGDLKIVFQEGQLVCTNADGNTSFPLSDLTKMYFTDEPTGIDEVTAGNSRSTVEVFSLSGIALGTFADIASAKSRLKAGVYVIKQGNKTTKIAIK
jgi:hypothetical protein